MVVRPEEVLNFLGPQPVGILRGVGARTLPILERMGLRTVADLRRLSLTELQRHLGSRAAASLYQQARALPPTGSARRARASPSPRRPPSART